MSAISLALPENRKARAVGGIARLLSPAPAFTMHSSCSPQRGQVEHYVFEQFRANHDAIVRDFMPLLLTTNCQGDYTSAVGIRPASRQEMFLEQYLPYTAEKALGELVGQCVKRGDVVEIGNLVATQRGSSQLLFLIMAAVLHRAGFEWMMFTATPQVHKMIKRLGLELHALGDADPSALDTDSLSSWGSYYESRPQILAGNLSEAMTIVANRKIFTRIISLYQHRIDAMASMIKQNSLRDDQHSFAA
jgi:hypothetical protein